MSSERLPDPDRRKFVFGAAAAALAIATEPAQAAADKLLGKRSEGLPRPAPNPEKQKRIEARVLQTQKGMQSQKFKDAQLGKGENPLRTVAEVLGTPLVWEDLKQTTFDPQPLLDRYPIQLAQRVGTKEVKVFTSHPNAKRNEYASPVTGNMETTRYCGGVILSDKKGMVIPGSKHALDLFTQKKKRIKVRTILRISRYRAI